MCLVVKNKKKLVTDKDIICYKVFRKLPNEILLSPYMYMQFSTQGICIDDQRMSPMKRLASGHYCISRGVFHSFKTKKAAMACTKWFSNVFGEFVVYKCRIPKGSIYYEGKLFNAFKKNRYKSYASKQIELLNEV